MTFGAAFLTAPDLFPARHSGERCGDAGLSLDIAGGPYRLSGLDRGQEQAVREAYAESRLPVGSPAPVEVRLFRAASSDFLGPASRGLEYSLDIRALETTVRVAGLGFMALLDLSDDPRASLWVSPGESHGFLGTLENFLRLLVAYRLLDQGGALLHSAAVAFDRAAYLFVGPSGAGKTTIARQGLAGGGTVLSDDMNGVRPDSQCAVVERLPFAGDLGKLCDGGSRYPLRGIFRLEKGRRNEIRPLDPAAALAFLTTCAPYVNSDRYRAERVLANLETLLARQPLRVLSFCRSGNLREIVTESARR